MPMWVVGVESMSVLFFPALGPLSGRSPQRHIYIYMLPLSWPLIPDYKVGIFMEKNADSTRSQP